MLKLSRPSVVSRRLVVSSGWSGISLDSPVMSASSLGLTWILELGPFSKNAWSDLVAGRQKRWYSKGLARRLPDDRAVFAERSE